MRSRADDSLPERAEVLWTPSAARCERSHLTAFLRWLEETRGLKFANHEELWSWSVRNLEGFWGAIWEYFDVRSSAPYDRVLARRQMPGAQWFPGARLNYAEHALRHERSDAGARDAGARDAVALMYASETQPLAQMTWAELGAAVRALAASLRELGISPGDRIVSVLPNSPQAIIALLATASLGAVWSCCGPDFGPGGILERFKQLSPKVIFHVDGYQYGGKRFDRRPEMRRILGELTSLEHVILVPYLDRNDRTPLVSGGLVWDELLARSPTPADAFRFEQVPFDHPLWILFSSGTTGLPKAIVHGHGGILLEHLKHLAFNYDVHSREALFFFTTTGWMVWNFLAGSLLSDVIPVLYDGNPAYPGPDALWRIVEASGARLFGTSPTYIAHQQKAGIVPKAHFDLSGLQTVTLAGSPVTAEHMRWLYENVKSDLWVVSGSGGTDCCTGFLGGVPTEPVHAGVIQGRALGCALYAFNEAGQPVIDEVGELVITAPMPSMPLNFWNDPGDARYRESYFDRWPGVWRHGDFVRFDARGGSHVLGRSDATLNRHGVRIGTAEIYRSLAGLAEIDDALIVNLDLPGGRFFMPLFVKLRGAGKLDAPLRERIRQRLRSDYSPRHVPDEIYQVDAIPMTLTGKKLEVPVRRILMGVSPDQAANRAALANPASLDWFIEFARRKPYAAQA
ncbi:MAG TPA: acetoacetate--CoA ligase [Steroidobacteraceae bacterium]|nr:acetoacetate--CoA ligase [Steroidobacteraceae bacterium]